MMLRRHALWMSLAVASCARSPTHVEEPASVVVESQPPAPMTTAQSDEPAAGPATRRPPAPAPPPREVSAEDRARARELFKDAVRAYDHGNYLEARQLFDQAYRIAPMPQVLYNLAMADLKDGDQQAACEHFRQWKATGSASPGLLSQAQATFAMCPP